MPRSGQERKARRRDRRRTSQVETDIPSDRPAELQGERGDVPPARRFATTVSIQPGDGSASILDLLAKSVAVGLQSSNARIAASAARTAIAMERLNQADEHHADDMTIKRAALEQRGGFDDGETPEERGVMVVPAALPDDQWEQAAAIVKQAALAERQQTHVDCERSGVDG